MKEIVERLQEKRNIEKAKSILESNGYVVKGENLNESALDDFWDLYDSSPEVGDALTKIADELGIDPDAEPTEEEARRILAAYKGEGNSTEVQSVDQFIFRIMTAVEDISSVANVESFADAGLMTNNKGFVVTTKDGKEYQFSLLGSF